MRQTLEAMERYLENWGHLSGREFQDPDKRRRAMYEAYVKGFARYCLSMGISSRATGSQGGQDISLMGLGDGSELAVTNGPSLGRHSFWEFDLRGFLRYRMPFATVACWFREGAGIESFFLHHSGGNVLETDAHLGDDGVKVLSQWLQSVRGLPRRFSVLGSVRDGFRLVSGRMRINDPEEVDTARKRMEDFRPYKAA